MLKNIIKIFVAGTAILALQSAYSMEIYTVKSGDYLYKIAKAHTVEDVSVGELTDAIKGINKSEIPGIVDNRIRVGNKLAIPTSKDEVEDGLTLSRHKAKQNSSEKQSETATNSSFKRSSKPKFSKLGDQAMIPNDEAESKEDSQQQNSSQSAALSMKPEDNTRIITYQNDLNSQINADAEQSNEADDSSSNESSSVGGIFTKLLKLISSLIVLGGIAIAVKKIWDNRSTKKAQEQEIESKKKRDHLMSRISPVVSDSDFYKAENDDLQQGFDFSTPKNTATQEYTESPNNHSSEDDASEDNLVEDESQNDNSDEPTNQDDKNIAIKTEKGMIFDTASSDKFTSMDNNVDEIDLEAYKENEMQYIEELIEQYLDSEKYIEASITIQDSLEKEPNNVNLRYMLLEVYARAGDEIAFEGEVHFIKSKNIVSMFDPLHQKIAKLRDKYFEYS